MARASLFVLDASVAVKWFVKEPFRRKALQVRADYLEDKIELKAPGLIWYEVGNALKFHPGATSQLVSSSVRTIEDMQIIETDSSTVDSESVARIAFEEKITFYDATYLTLAEKHICRLLTDDRSLYKKLGKRRHLLQLLEDYRPATSDKHETALQAAAGLNKGKRRSILELAGILTRKEAEDLRSTVREIRSKSNRRMQRTAGRLRDS